MVRERSVAAPELRALLLPLLMMNAIPPGARATTLGRDDLQFRPVDDEAFLAGPGTPPAAHRYRLEWKDLPAAATTLEVALRDGLHFEIARERLPRAPVPLGKLHCRRAVRHCGQRDPAGYAERDLRSPDGAGSAQRAGKRFPAG